MTKRTYEKLVKIAMEESIYLRDRGDLEDHWNDDDDYPEVSIWSIRKMLERAYELGVSDEKKKKK